MAENYLKDVVSSLLREIAVYRLLDLVGRRIIYSEGIYDRRHARIRGRIGAFHLYSTVRE